MSSMSHSWDWRQRALLSPTNHTAARSKLRAPELKATRLLYEMHFPTDPPHQPYQPIYCRESLRKLFSWPWVNYLRLSLEDGYRAGKMLCTRALRSLSSEVKRWVRKLPWKWQVNLPSPNISPWKLPRTKGTTAPASHRFGALDVICFFRNESHRAVQNSPSCPLQKRVSHNQSVPVAWHQDTSQHTTIKQEKHNSTPKELEKTAQTTATVTACKLSALWHASSLN